MMFTKVGSQTLYDQHINKKPSAEKKLAPPERRASKVNIISQKVRPFCGLHIKCISGRFFEWTSYRKRIYQNSLRYGKLSPF